MEDAMVLVVDDDQRMLHLINLVLEIEGYRVTTATRGDEALELIINQNPDLILLDVMLPDTDGYSLCQRIREFSQIPIIMVSARGAEDDRVYGLVVGADDYITKPFSSRELVARVKVALRHTNIDDKMQEGSYNNGDLTLDRARRRISVNGRNIRLTATEWRLLLYLVNNAGRVITPEQALDKVWGEEYANIHTLHVNVARIRKKLGDDPQNPRYILTRRGIGYMMEKIPQISSKSLAE